MTLLPGLPIVVTACDSYDENPIVTFYNTTDSPLCYLASRPDCSESIKPRATSHWTVDSCFRGQQGGVWIHTESGREIYTRSARCEEWGDDAFIVINKRDGEFVVAGSLPSP